MRSSSAKREAAIRPTQLFRQTGQLLESPPPVLKAYELIKTCTARTQHNCVPYSHQHVDSYNIEH